MLTPSCCVSKGARWSEARDSLRTTNPIDTVSQQRMREVLIVQPPLRISRDFVDYPYLVGLGAYQAAAVIRTSGAFVKILDGFTGPNAQLFDERSYAWLGTAPEDFLTSLRSLGTQTVVINMSV